MTDSALTRDERGRFPKGVSGNPSGRPKGSKTRIVQQKLALEEAVRAGVPASKIQRILEVMSEAAMNGDITAGKYILDKFISNAKVEEDADSGDKGITVVVKNATFRVEGENTEKPIEGEIVESSEQE